MLTKRNLLTNQKYFDESSLTLANAQRDFSDFTEQKLQGIKKIWKALFFPLELDTPTAQRTFLSSASKEGLCNLMMIRNTAIGNLGWTKRNSNCPYEKEIN